MFSCNTHRKCTHVLTWDLDLAAVLRHERKLLKKKLGFKEGINCDSRRLIRPQKKPMIFTLLEKLAGSVKISFENVAADTSDWIKK